MAARLNDPPEGWGAMVELLATEPAPAALEEKEGGLLARLGRLVFTSAADRINQRAEVDLRRLGLATTQRPAERMPATGRVATQTGPTIVKGERHGRAVEIWMDPDRYRVRLSGAVAELHVRSGNGRLRASERSPAAVHDALAGLSGHRRWDGVEAKGGPDGVSVFHRPQSVGGSAYYLDDLWLAEALAEVAASP